MSRRIRLVGVVILFVLGTAGIATPESDIYAERSLYRNIFVSESFGKRCMRFTRSNHIKQACISLDNPESLLFDCNKLMLGALYLRPDPRRVLVIGLGGGILPNSLFRVVPTVDIDVVEIDPAIVRVAKKFFNFRTHTRMRVFEEDGRVFVKRALKRGEKYDLIILDAFDQEYIPEHLLTKEFLNEVKTILAADGVLAANTFYLSGLYDNESVTYEAVYGEFFNLKKFFANTRVIIVKRDGLPSSDILRKNAKGLEERLRPLGIESSWLLSLFSTQQDWDANARILTDQYSPSNLFRSSFN